MYSQVKHNHGDLERGDQGRGAASRLLKELRSERSARREAEAVAARRLNELEESRHRLSLLERVATAANKCGSVDEALRFAVFNICQHMSWAVGLAYRRIGDPEPQVVPTGVWHAANPKKVQPLVSLSTKTSFSSGIGIPGLVLNAASPLFLDITTIPHVERMRIATECGMRSVIALPVTAGVEVAAVIEFFSEAEIVADDGLLELMAQIGSQIGRVIERKHAEERLVHEALHDSLTSLPNRALFIDRLDKALRRTRRNPDNKFAALFMDLDGFKLVNDSLGHHAGDKVLVNIAERLRTTLASAEQLASEQGRHWPRWILARLGGDEFTVLLDDMEGYEQAIEIAAMLHLCLEPPHEFDGQGVFIAASIGVAPGQPSYQKAADIMRDADLAMYEAKSRGRSRTAIFNEAMHREADRRLQLESDLRRGVKEKEFVLFYQPIWHLATRQLVAFEALLRWQRSPDQLINPIVFMEIAEETGLIVPLGDWVLHEACATAARWRLEHGASTPEMCVNVNISPKQFLQPGFTDQVRRAIDENGIEAKMLCLEVTEGIAIHDPGRTANVLTELRSWGVHVSLDDFGTGYSSLGYVRQLPFDTIKIDRSFVSGIRGDDTMQGIVGAVLSLADALDRKVVAEGIETEEECAALIAMGCTYGQGYYLGRPMAGDKVDAVIVASNRPGVDAG